MSDERKVKNNETLNDVMLIFRNFRGEAQEFNSAGDRNFGVLLRDDDAERLAAIGWPVKYLKPAPDDPDQYRQPWMKVKVKFGQYPPSATLINSRGRRRLDEETIGQLDWTRIETCDLVISPYNYVAFGSRPAGVTAYLKSIYVTIQEDELEMKYADLRDLDQEE